MTNNHCVVNFQIMQHFDLSIGVLGFCVFVSGSNLFLYCYFGGRATNDIVSYSNLLFESAWFKLPTEIQKFIVVMIANAQVWNFIVFMYYQGTKSPLRSMESPQSYSKQYSRKRLFEKNLCLKTDIFARNLVNSEY